jgi:hypothetical protein
MAKLNFAQGGDIHYNENYALYPQNAFINGRPEFGWSKTLLKPAHHWEGGHYAPVRHISLNDECTNCGLREAASDLKAADTFLTHIIPSMSLLTDLHYVIHTPLVGAEFSVQTAAGTPTAIGVIDAGVVGNGWFTLATPLYVPSTTNNAIEFIIDEWPVDVVVPEDEDPCGVFANCKPGKDLCMTITAFYKHARAEAYCEDVCWDNCGC